MAKKKGVKKKVAKKGVNKNKFDKFFLLTWKKAWMVVVAWFIAVMLHNFIYAAIKYLNPMYRGDEAFFFIIAVIVIPLYVLVSLIYSVVKFISKKFF